MNVPADEQHELRYRWARPQDVSGESDGDARRRGARRRPLADGLTVRAATPPTAMGRAAQKLGVRAISVQVRLGEGVGPSFVMRPHHPCVPPHMVHLPGAFMLGGEWANS